MAKRLVPDASVRQFTRRESKKLATRQGLRRAALRLAAKRGLQGVTVEDITNAADVSLRTFYEHFESKEAALVSYEDAAMDLRQLVAERPDNEAPLEALREALRIRAASWNAETEGARRILAISDDPNLRREVLIGYWRLEMVLAEALAARTPGDNNPGSLRNRLVSAIAVTAIRIASEFGLSTENSLPLPEALDAAFLLIREGLDYNGSSDPRRAKVK